MILFVISVSTVWEEVFVVMTLSRFSSTEFNLRSILSRIMTMDKSSMKEDGQV